MDLFVSLIATITINMKSIKQFNFNWNGRENGKVQIYARTWKEAHATMIVHNCSYNHFRNYTGHGNALLGVGNATIVLGSSVTMEEVESQFPRYGISFDKL